jgi:hypothetical protein
MMPRDLYRNSLFKISPKLLLYEKESPAISISILHEIPGGNLIASTIIESREKLLVSFYKKGQFVLRDLSFFIFFYIACP